MELDWITVAAQAVNFLVLVWVLQRLLYRPVTRAMERRAEAIRERFAEAERRERAATTAAERLQAEREAFEAERESLMEDARREADALRQKLESAAREAVAERRATWQDQLSREQETFLADLRRDAADHVARLARRALGDLAGADLEREIARTFVSHLAALDGKAMDDLRAEAHASGGEMTVTTGFDLPETARSMLLDALRDKLHPQARVAFERDPALVCGVRLKLRGKTLQWSIDAYLDDLQEEIAGALDRDAPAEAAE